MDVNRHVNNVEYFRFLEQARIEWFHSLIERRGDDSHSIVVASASCNFLRPMTYPGTIEVCVAVTPPGRSSFNLYYDIHPEQDRTIKYADAHTRAVWIDKRTGRSAPLPEYMRKRLV